MYVVFKCTLYTIENVQAKNQNVITFKYDENHFIIGNKGTVHIL